MTIPAQMQPVYEEIAGMIDEYCEKYLNEEYRALCLRLLEKLCRKRPSPLLKGRRNTWAAGMPIHLTADELSRPFGIAPSTAGNKAAEIRKLIRMSPWDTEWLLQELIEDNPAIWMLSVDGFIVDARDLPLEFQQEAARRGLIPYVPAPRQKQEKPEQSSEKVDNPAPNSSQDCVSNDSPSESAPPADFSDIYDRFRTM